MNLFIFGNNNIAIDIIKILKKTKGVNIKGFCFTKNKFQKKKIEIEKILPKSTKKYLYLDNKKFINEIKKLNCTVALSVGFSHILKKNLIDLFDNGIINLHLSYLPFCKGSAPNVFAIINNEPAGTTLHYIDEKLDEGKIIDQEKVIISDIDTGESLYNKLYVSAIKLFKKNLNSIINNKIKIKKNNFLKGSIYYHKQLNKIDKINKHQKITAKKLIDILRARTFKNYESAYFVSNKKKIYMRIDLSYKKFYKND